MSCRTGDVTFSLVLVYIWLVLIPLALGVGSCNYTSSIKDITVTCIFDPKTVNYTASFVIDGGYDFTNTIPTSSPPFVNPISFTYNQTVSGQKYRVLVEEVHSDNIKIFIYNVTVAVVPLKPVNLKVQDRGEDFLTLFWNTSFGTVRDSHEIYYRKENETNAEMVLSPSADNKYKLTNLSHGTKYVVYIVAVTLDAKSQESDKITESTAPKPPTNVTAVPNDSSKITVSWSPPDLFFQGSYLAKYTPRGEQAEVNITGCTKSSCTFTPKNVPSGQPLLISVYSLSQGIYSVAASVNSSTAPGSVSNFHGSSKEAGLVVSWIAPINSEQVSYTINATNLYSLFDSKIDSEPANNITSFTKEIMGLIGGSLYEVKIQAESTFAKGEISTSNIYTLPERVNNLSGVAINTTAYNLTWDLSSRSRIAYLNITVSPESMVQISKSTFYVITDLKPGNLYNVSIVTISDINPAFPSPLVQKDFRTKPVKPKINSVIANETSLTIGITRESSEGEWDYIMTHLNTLSVQVKMDEVKFDNLEPGRLYRLEAYTAIGVARSDNITVNLFTKPKPPKSLDVWVNGTRFRAKWESPDFGFDGFNVTLTKLVGTEFLIEQHQGPIKENEIGFPNLTAGATYRVTVVTVKGDQASTAISKENTTDPDSVAALQKVQATTDSITVNWTAPTSVNIDFYQLGILVEDVTTKPNEPPLVVPKNVTNATFSNLEPGFFYTIAIRTVKSGPAGQAPQFGPAVRLKTVTKPLPVMDLEVNTLNTTAVGVRWSLNKTSKQNWVQVQYGDKLQRLPVRNLSDFSIVLSGLLPGSSYNISVQAIRFNDTDEESSNETVARGNTAPMPVQNLNITADRSRILLSWSPPALGSVGSYNVYYWPILRGSSMGKSTRSTSSTNIRLSDLFPGEKYLVNVTAVSNSLESTHVTGEAVIDPDPPRSLLPDKSKTTTSSVTVYWFYNIDDTFNQWWTVQARDGSFLVTHVVEQIDGQTDYELEIDQLTPGHTYNISIKSHVVNRVSSEIFTNVTTKPVINSVLTESSSSNSSITITYTVAAEDVFDHFIFNISGGQPVIKAKSDVPSSVGFTNLQAGTKYTVTAYTVINFESSSPIIVEIYTDPNPVPVHLSSTSKTVSLLLGPQVGEAAQYTIVCTSASNRSCGEKTVAAQVIMQPIVFTDLLPFHEYMFRVITKTTSVNNSVKMATEEFMYRTAEAPPGPVRSFTLVDKDLHSVMLSWEPPSMTNGDIKYYTISYVGSEPTDPETRDEKELTVNGLSNTITDLKAGYKYIFKISAFTIEKGDEEVREITMKTAAPTFKANYDAESSKPHTVSDKTLPGITQNQISFELKNPFSPDNGLIKYYTVIASLDPSVSDKDSLLPSWLDVQKNSNLKFYLAANCTDLFARESACEALSESRHRRDTGELDSQTFVLGGETSTSCINRPFCNGPLTPGTEYAIKLRGYTASGQYQETAYSDKVKTKKLDVSKAELIGGVVAGIFILIILIIIAVLLVKKIRNQPKKAVKYSAPRPHWKHSVMSQLSRPVKLVDFPTHVQKMSSDSDLKYAEEYEDLKDVGRDQPCTAAEFPPNRPKNRFTNILPYDHSRVKLLPTDDEEGSDYINANYMPGYSSKREYIATQGPLPSTRDDFWRMIWEQNCRNIVMLTRCQEKGREKSDHYWPNDAEPKFYGDLQVTILNETHMPDWTITEFKVAMGEQSRNVRHFHYLVWPDFGVPSTCTSLIRFVRTVREKLIREGGPIVTHCSAGVGRSGTFIVLDHLLQLIREKDEVDIFSLVYKLRKERVLMVQTEQQYKFIHECLLCVLEGREEDITYMNFGQVNAAFEEGQQQSIVDQDTDFGINMDHDDEGINVETV
ncbi:tyrosine-protein phosphatase 10D-like isoform X3 [Biomphalaria glabrata]|uniref:protein-tyrosine-phosphatase n=1 Tax=Biomphalaria glabrata TaxID=6526 RepID=A0A9W3AKA2_BIOGL|nr:tyrosine-protein phosphatase 10D-like isoform X3 [Biomphalaria glabrata]